LQPILLAPEKSQPNRKAAKQAIHNGYSCAAYIL
jgi:hypothetical protein